MVKIIEIQGKEEVNPNWKDNKRFHCIFYNKLPFTEKRRMAISFIHLRKNK